MPIGIKFSQFIAGGNLKVTDKTVGIRGDENTIFSDPSDGILDENGNYLLRYISGSPNAVNAVLFKNAATGAPAEITIGGSDADASLKISAKGNGSLLFETPSEGDITLKNTGNGSTNFISSGLGDINFSTNVGRIYLNSTAPLYGFTTDATFTNPSDEYAPSALAVKTYINSSTSALANLTYVTNTDETANLPNSVQLLGTTNQIAVTDGVLSFAPSLIMPAFSVSGDINISDHAIVTNSGKDLILAPGDQNLDVIDLRSKYVNVLESIIFNNTPTDNITFNHTTSTLYFNMSNTEVLSLSALGVSLGADLLLKTHKITSSSGTPIQLVPDNDADGIDLSSTIVRLETDLQHAGESNNKISFTTGAQTYYIDGNSIYDINASGFRLGGANARITSISDDTTMSANSATLGVTQHAAKTYADSVGGGAVTLTSAGIAIGAQSAVNDGTGPSLAIKGFVGSNGLTTSSNGTDLTIGITASSSSAGKVLRATGSTWDASTTTFADTYSKSSLLYASADNTVSELTAYSGSVLCTGSLPFKIPQWVGLANGQVLIGSTGNVPVAATLTAGNDIIITNGAGSITIAKTSSYGTIWMNSSSWAGTTSIAFTTSFQELASMSVSFSLVSPNSDFTMTTDGRLKYTGSATKICMVSAYFAINNAGNFAIQIFKNANAIPGADAYSAGAQSAVITPCPVTFSTNDYISLWAKRSAGGVSPAITQVTISAWSIA